MSPLLRSVVFIGGICTQIHIGVNFCFEYSYWIMAGAWSFLLAFFAYEIHGHFVTKKKEIKYAVEETLYLPQIISDYKDQSLPIQIHQFIFNFAGAMVGWVIIYFGLYSDSSSKFEGWEQILLASITFISLTGYLPYIITKFGAFGK